ILRKGGIAEGRGGFRPRGEPFWLLPTAFHEQAEKLRPEAEPWLLPAPDAASVKDTVALTAWAELSEHRFIDNWPKLVALAPHHLWTEDTVRERFDWSQPPGLHVLVVRVHRLQEALPFQLTP